ncbi:MAG: restriction endonuclease subunit S, partial [Cyanobacteria bacterium REEB444]|nr:restriction endonuclease subunit S [Cyanobacteria bacterium REEB444]
MSELPKGWIETTVDKIAYLVSGKTPKNVAQFANHTGSVPWVKVSDMTLPGNEQYVSKSVISFSESECKNFGLPVIPEGSVIFPKNGGAIATGKKRQTAINCSIDLNTMAVIPTGINKDFLFYWIQTVDLSKLSDGSVVPQINKSDIAPLCFPLPPLNEQRRIVAKLDRLFARSRCAREELGRVSGLVQRYKQAVLAAAFRGDLTADWREENTDVETAPELLKRIQAKRQDLPNQKRKSIGGGRSVSDSFETPATWLGLTLGDVIDYGKTVKSEPDEIPHDAWVLELEDIEKDKSKLLQRMTFAQRLSKSTKNRFVAGDVLYGKLRPYLNKVLIADQDGYCTTEIIPIKANIGVHECYLFYWLKHPEFLNYVESVSHGIQMPRLGTEAGLQAP